jgi:hypothetical protein
MDPWRGGSISACVANPGALARATSSPDARKNSKLKALQNSFAPSTYGAKD